MTPLAGTSPEGVCCDGLNARFVVRTVTVSTLPFDQVAAAGPLTSESKPRRRNCGGLTMSRIVSRETFLRLAVTLPLNKMGTSGAWTRTLRDERDCSGPDAEICAGTGCARGSQGWSATEPSISPP